MFRFIIVDSDYNVRDEIASIIDWERVGFKLVGSYNNINNALNAMESQNIDLVLSNLYTLEFDGLSFAGIIKNKYPSSKIILYSSMVNTKPLLQAFKLKIDDFLMYPIDVESFYYSICYLAKELNKSKEYTKTIRMLKTKVNVLEKKQDIIEDHHSDNYISYEYFKTNINKYSVLLSGNTFCVAVLKGSDKNIPASGVKCPIYYSIYNLVDDFLKAVENCLVVQSIYEYTVVIMSDKCGDLLDRKFHNYLKTIKNKVNTELGLDLCIGIGRNVYALNDILGSWKDAISAVDYKYVLGYNSIISYDDIIMKTNNEINNSILSYEKRIVEAIHQNNFSDTVYNINLFFQHMRANLHSYENYYYYVHRMIISIRKALSKNSAISSKGIFDSFSVLAKCNFNFIDNDEELLISTIKKLMNSSTTKKEYCSENICKKAMDYIENNYNNPELSLNMVCKHLALSVSYFSSIFKNYSGTTFVDYLTSIRIEKAKELLITTEHKSYQIAEKIGYNDPHYFSILFKKKTGMSPTKYKQTIVQCKR